MKKIITLIISASLMAALFSGCKTGTAEQPSVSPAQSADVTAATPSVSPVPSSAAPESPESAGPPADSGYDGTALAVTMGGVDFTGAEFDYFYYNTFHEYSNYMVSQFGEQAYSYLPSNDTPHSQQVLNVETGETWADYFTEYALEQLTEMVQYYIAATEAGHTLSDEMRGLLEDEIAASATYAEQYGYTSQDEFLKDMFGPAMDETSLREVLEFIYLAASYSAVVHDSFTYSADELTEYYAENRNTLDNFTFRYFQIIPEAAAIEEGAAQEEIDAANTAALADALAEAQAAASRISDEESFIAEARESNESVYGEPGSTLMTVPGSALDASYGTWLCDAARRGGDVTFTDSPSGAAVVQFIGRDPNEYEMASMRQILIMHGSANPADFEGGETDPAYIEALADAQAEAAERAESVVRLFTEGGATEEKFIELIPEYSEDTTEGGFYDGITKSMANNKMVREIEDWLFAPGRKTGDYELVETESYGYHFLYFTGYGERYCDFLATASLRGADMAEWSQSLPVIETVRHDTFDINHY